MPARLKFFFFHFFFHPGPAAAEKKGGPLIPNMIYARPHDQTRPKRRLYSSGPVGLVYYFFRVDRSVGEGVPTFSRSER